MKASAVVGVIMLMAVVAIVLVTAAPHAAAGPTTSPTPSVVPTLAHATPVPSPEPLDVATGTMAHVALIGWLVALSILPLFALIGIALHARHRSRLVELDHPPLRRPEFVNRAFDVKALEARRGWLPESFTFSPNTRHEAPIVEDAATPALPPHMLTLDDLLRGPGVTYGTDVATGQPLTDDRVRSLLVGGIPGSGKSTFVCLVVAQLVQRGASISLGDPHAGHPESLANRLEVLGIRPTVEAEPRRIRELVETAAQEIQARKHGSPSAHPLIVVVDELPEQVRLLGDRDRERLRTALEVLGFSGRKFNVSTLLMSQSWTRAVVGGTAVRNLVPAAAIFRMRRDEALAMSGLRAESWPDDPLNLPPGEAYLVGVGSGITRIQVPKVEVSSRGVQPGVQPLSLPAPRGHPGDTPQDTGEDTSRDSEILRAFRRTGDVNRVAREVFNVEPGGAAWQRARQRVNGALQRALSRAR